ncbi:hypothetical protein GGS21DRAFT_523272 [Xylaria nigripes]|nr:hypothetical protein GGS21DRAFT_523272 [Xylaria nigripes]
MWLSKYWFAYFVLVEVPWFTAGFSGRSMYLTYHICFQTGLLAIYCMELRYISIGRQCREHETEARNACSI